MLMVIFIFEVCKCENLYNLYRKLNLKVRKATIWLTDSVQNRQQPRLETLYEIARILEVEIKDLLIENDITKDK